MGTGWLVVIVGHGVAITGVGALRVATWAYRDWVPVGVEAQIVRLFFWRAFGHGVFPFV